MILLDPNTTGLKVVGTVDAPGTRRRSTGGWIGEDRHGRPSDAPTNLHVGGTASAVHRDEASSARLPGPLRSCRKARSVRARLSELEDGAGALSCGTASGRDAGRGTIGSGRTPTAGPGSQARPRCAAGKTALASAAAKRRRQRCNARDRRRLAHGARAPRGRGGVDRRELGQGAVEDRAHEQPRGRLGDLQHERRRQRRAAADAQPEVRRRRPAGRRTGGRSSTTASARPGAASGS